MRLDFGKPFEVTRIEVDNGFQTSHEGVDALPISEADWKRGVVSVGMHQVTWDIPFVLEFERRGGTWAVVEASCRDGKDACGPTHTMYPDAGDPEIVKGACN